VTNSADWTAETKKAQAKELAELIAELEAELAQANAQIASHIATCKAFTDVAVAAERERVMDAVEKVCTSDQCDAILHELKLSK